MNIGKTVVFQVLKNQRKNFFYLSGRPLVQATFIKLESFKNRRKNILNNFVNANEYKSRLKESIEGDKNHLMFCNDVINMISLSTTDEDLDVLKKLLIKISMQEGVTSKRFCYGPEIMRLFHIMNKPTEAISLVKNEQLFYLFNNQTSCFVLLDLLWKNQMYHEIIEIYEMYAKRWTEIKNWYYVNILFFCACYKENTSKSYYAASITFDQLTSKRISHSTVVKLFFAALAFKQNHLTEAMELLAPLWFNAAAENTKLLIFSRSKRFSDVIQNIKNLAFATTNRKTFLCSEVMETVKKDMADADDESFVLLQQLKEKLPKNFIKEMTYDELLFKNVYYLSSSMEMEADLESWIENLPSEATAS